METLLKALPFVLLTTTVPYVFFTDPNIAQSIIIAVLAALSGYQYYLSDKKKPNYVEIFKSEFEEYKKDLNSRLETSDKEFKEMREAYVKSTFGKSKPKDLNEVFRF